MFPTDTHILIVDDEWGVRSALRNQLRNFDFKFITEARTGAEALIQLNQLHEDRQPIDLIISDWNMPEMTGIELLKAVRLNPKFSFLPFLMVTSQKEAEPIREAIDAGVSHYIIKPFSATELRKKLELVWAKCSKDPKNPTLKSG